MLRCSKEAFELCPTAHLCGSREDSTFKEGSDCDKFNQEVEKNAPRFGRWIPVTERLPERTMPPHDVLVYHDLGCGMFVDRAWYSYDKRRWCSVLGMKLKVTHWMPLPNGPEEVGR